MTAADDARAGRLPDFIGVGPGRAGTTWLHAVLSGHVGLPRDTKETDFFCKNYPKGLRWYRDYFRGFPPELPLGEICPTYFTSEEARQRIAQHIPSCRIICTFRDPVERIYSGYKLMRRNVWTRASFEEAVDKHPRMTEMNRYGFHLRAWHRYFGSENVLVCIYDDLRTDPQGYLDRVADFIGIARFPLDDSAATERPGAITHAPRNRRLAQNARHVREWLASRRAHRLIQFLEDVGVWKLCFEGGEKFGPLDPGVEARLRERFRPEVEALEELIHRDLSAWKRPPGAEREGREPPGTAGRP